MTVLSLLCVEYQRVDIFSTCVIQDESENKFTTKNAIFFKKGKKKKNIHL